MELILVSEKILEIKTSETFKIPGTFFSKIWRLPSANNVLENKITGIKFL